MSELRNFYGGAIQGQLPAAFRDVSDLRPVPDHQEVLMDDQECSIILELLDLNREESEDQMIKYYFTDLAEHNESEQTRVLAECLLMPDQFMPKLGPSFTRMALIGKQSVKKYRSETSPLMDVYICMVLIRLRNVDTDLLVTLNFPANDQLRQACHSFEQLDSTLQSTDILLPSNDIAQVYQDVFDAQPAIPAFRELLGTLTVQDWSLFSG